MKHSILLSSIMAAVLTGCGGGYGDSEETMELTVEPLGSVSTSTAYLSPSQVRTRYGFDGLPNTPAGQGSGQLIAVISAYHNPDLANNLKGFSEKYNLPQCTTVTTEYTTLPSGYLGANVSHPAVGEQCTFQVINVDSLGRPSKLVPQSGKAVANWAFEATMDIEWAHAIAPQASIVVIQAPNNLISGMGFASKYASAVGANVVSMSWGANEAGVVKCARRPGQPTVQYDPTCSDIQLAATYWSSMSKQSFTGNATFVAASGDQGKLLWPSITPTVLAVGGTVAGTSIDTGWSGSGGGVSTSFTAPSWQPAISYTTNRAVPDVSYDAGKAVAVYITPNAYTGWADANCVTANGAANCGWYGGGGTSAGTPQWAGLIAVANAMRGSPITGVPSKLYDIALVPGQYAVSFGDVLTGGTATYQAKTGYDFVTGLGVPNASVLINYLTL